MILGAGYTMADLDNEAASVFFTDDFSAWNVGVDLDIGAFGIGAIYTENNNGQDVADKNETWVVGGDYTTGPFKLGVSYLNNDVDAGVTNYTELDRYTAGVVYSYGPGMTFRGSVGYNDVDGSTTGDDDATTVTVGTQINF